MAATRPALLVLLLALVAASTAAPAAAAVHFSRSSRPGVSSPKCDWRGHDLAWLSTTECARVCQLVLGCSHWTWAWERGANRCYLKTGRRPLSDAFYRSGHYACGAMI